MVELQTVFDLDISRGAIVADVKLFQLKPRSVIELEGRAVALEKSLQDIFEANLDALLGVRFLASEYRTTNRGRMDTIGIDENNCPVIIEYKRSTNENVINQGLFYLDWLMDHRADFHLLVMDKLGKAVSDLIEWSSPRLICIAGDFTKYDSHAVNQMNRNIELIRYVRFESDLLLLEQITAASVENGSKSEDGDSKSKTSGVTYKTVTEYLAQSDQELKDRFEAVRAYLSAQGDDVQEKTLKFYFAFRRIKNFACVEVRPQTGKVLVYLKVDPDKVELIGGFTRDVRKIGHYGTGDLEVTITKSSDFERAKPLFDASYEAS
jgi:predicted transport protein